MPQVKKLGFITLGKIKNVKKGGWWLKAETITSNSPDINLGENDNFLTYKKLWTSISELSFSVEAPTDTWVYQTRDLNILSEWLLTIKFNGSSSNYDTTQISLNITNVDTWDIVFDKFISNPYEWNNPYQACVMLWQWNYQIKIWAKGYYTYSTSANVLIITQNL
jgi:hypothetical protein